VSDKLVHHWLVFVLFYLEREYAATMYELSLSLRLSCLGLINVNLLGNIVHY